jgi:hypothetical protein
MSKANSLERQIEWKNDEEKGGAYQQVDTTVISLLRRTAIFQDRVTNLWDTTCTSLTKSPSLNQLILAPTPGRKSASIQDHRSRFESLWDWECNILFDSMADLQ